MAEARALLKQSSLRLAKLSAGDFPVDHFAKLFSLRLVKIQMGCAQFRFGVQTFRFPFFQFLDSLLFVLNFLSGQNDELDPIGHQANGLPNLFRRLPPAVR